MRLITIAIIFVLFGLLFGGQPALARGSADKGFVTRIDSSADNLVYVYVDGAITEVPPACATFTASAKRWVFNGSTTSGKIMLAKILAAASTKNKIKVYGGNSCSLMSNTETLGILEVYY